MSNTKDNSFFQTLRNDIDNAIHRFIREKYEEKKKILIQEMDTAFEKEVAGIALLLSQQISFENMSN